MNGTLNLLVFIIVVSLLYLSWIQYTGLKSERLSQNMYFDASLRGQLLQIPHSSGNKSVPLPLPSIRLSASEETEAAKLRTYYGGKGDRPHLGGFIEYDMKGISNNTWNWMLGPLSIRSVLDVGCGRGISTSYFRSHGAKVLCVEGSHDAVTQSLLPREDIVEHDYTRGPWWPQQTFDAVWCVEFVEHVGRQYMPNYLPTFRQAALIFVTHALHGGWHHVELRPNWWWKARFTAAGFIFSDDLTRLARAYARATSVQASGSYLFSSLMVFINPAVSSLPAHEHLIGGHGCVWGNSKNVPCTSQMKWFQEDVDALPRKYESLLDCRLNETTTVWVCERNKLSTA